MKIKPALIESSINVWKQIVDDNASWAIVIEDDAAFQVDSFKLTERPQRLLKNLILEKTAQ